MQRVEPRELVAASGCAALPLAWGWLAATGLLPDVLDSDAGAGLAYAIGAWRGGDFYLPSVPLGVALGVLVPGTPVAAARVVLAAFVWAVGYAGWRLAGDRPVGERVGVAILAQLGPWTTLSLWQADLPALGFAPVMLALCFPRLGLLAGLCGAPAAAAVATIGLLRRRWALAAGAVGLLVLMTAPVEQPGAALRSAAVVSLGPAYGGQGGAWFPMPPQEHARWARASASYGRWVHPRVVEGNTGSGPSKGPDRLDGPQAQAVAEPTGFAAVLSTWSGATAGTVIESEQRALGLAGMVAPLWGVLLWLAVLLLGPRGGLPTLALLGSAGGLVLAARAAWHQDSDGPQVSGADLSAVVSRLQSAEDGAVMLFPPPSAPYFAGRISEDRWRAFLLASDREQATAPALAGALGWRMEYGLDVAAARPTWEARGDALPFVAARDAGIRVLVIDTASDPSFVWQNTEGWIARRVGQPERFGDLAVYDLPSGIEAFGGGEGVVDDEPALVPAPLTP